ncbi:MAG: dTDP-4-dehydrorhamnose 3,5-epimerase [Bacteroidia bacterium]|nr:dTDP-4-dehydrorhamnose 3,5-epimerase [Bacteroidia bacterium]
MDFKKRRIEGVIEISLNPIRDNRGFFMRTLDEKIFIEEGIVHHWVQENHSKSIKKGIIRGLHFQLPPFSEAKLVRCISGAIFDVFVDLRKDSPTFGQWDSVILNEDNYTMILIPRGLAHGFCTLTTSAEVLYKVDNFYNPDAERGLLWSDHVLNINWPTSEPIVSEKDQKNMTFETFIKQFKHLSV